MNEFKVKNSVNDFTVACDITLNKVEVLAKRDMVGRMEYLKLNRVEMLKWVTKNCKPLIDYIPQPIWLSNGWFFFIFLNEE